MAESHPQAGIPALNPDVCRAAVRRAGAGVLRAPTGTHPGARAGVALLAAILVAGCGPSSSPSGGGGSTAGTSSGGTNSGGTTPGGTTPGGTTPGSSGSTGTAAKVCRIATLGFAGEWGQGNVFTGWLGTQSTEGTTALADGVLTPEALAPFQLIVVQDVRVGAAGQAGVGHGIGRAYGAAEVRALQDWVAAGGGLMTLMGYGDSSEIVNVNRLLEPFGLSYGSTNCLFGGGTTAPVTHWADHPIAAGVTRVGANNGYPVLGAGTLIAWEPTPGSVDAGRALDSGKGRVFSWADEWITYDTEWTGHPDYQVARFWANALTWLTANSGCAVPLPNGEW